MAYKFNPTTGRLDLVGALLGANTFTGLQTMSSSGLITPKIYPASDSTTAVQINRADGTTNVLNVDTTNGNVGIGTTAPGYKLTVSGGDAYFTNSIGAGVLPATGTRLGSVMAGDASANNLYSYDGYAFSSTNGAFQVYGGRFIGYAGGSAAQTGQVIGVETAGANLGSGLVTALVGNKTAVYVFGTGNVTDSYAFLVAGPSITNTGTIGAAYGIYVSSQKVTGVTTGVGIYQVGASDINYFAGDVGIGTVTPGKKLDVAGAIALTGLLHLGKYTTGAAPSPIQGATYFDTTLGKMRIGNNTPAWESVTSA